MNNIYTFYKQKINYFVEFTKIFYATFSDHSFLLLVYLSAKVDGVEPSFSY